MLTSPLSSPFLFGGFHVTDLDLPVPLQTLPPAGEANLLEGKQAGEVQAPLNAKLRSLDERVAM